MALTYLGCVDILGGLNAAGVAITAYRLDGQTLPTLMVDAGDSFPSTGGVVSSTLVRTVLGSASNLDQAIELAQSLAIAGGQAWVALVSSSAADDAVVIEFDGHDLRLQSAAQMISVGEISWPIDGADRCRYDCSE